jgi:hypothetical protein
VESNSKHREQARGQVLGKVQDQAQGRDLGLAELVTRLAPAVSFPGPVEQLLATQEVELSMTSTVISLMLWAL